MIPKIIHYCWFGGKPLPTSAKRCIESWKKFLPGYEIKRWDESNFDVNIIPYTSQAYTAKKYAFVSDYARFKILYEHGGLYFDTDVELIQSIDDIINKGPFMGCENPYNSNSTPNELCVAPGLGLGIIPKHPFYNEIISFYNSIDFVNPNGKHSPKTVVTYITKLLCQSGLRNTPDIQSVEGISIYPSDFFCPISTVDGILRLTSNTRSIHWYDQTWQSPARRYARKILLKCGGVKLKNLIKQIILNK